MNNNRCFDDEKEECTKDAHRFLDLTPEQIETVVDWVKFYDEHPKYKFVGVVELPDQ